MVTGITTEAWSEGNKEEDEEEGRGLGQRKESQSK